MTEFVWFGKLKKKMETMRTIKVSVLQDLSEKTITNL